MPDLGNNIRHGNSLIGTDFRTFDQMQLPLMGDEEIHEFDWATAFPLAFREGGFEVVIGNPPYLSFGGPRSARRHAPAKPKRSISKN